MYIKSLFYDTIHVLKAPQVTLTQADIWEVTADQEEIAVGEISRVLDSSPDLFSWVPLVHPLSSTSIIHFSNKLMTFRYLILLEPPTLNHLFFIQQALKSTRPRQNSSSFPHPTPPPVSPLGNPSQNLRDARCFLSLSLISSQSAWPADPYSWISL